MTGHEDMTSAIGAMRAGAFDYVVKPIEVEALQDLVVPVPEGTKAEPGGPEERGTPSEAEETGLGWSSGGIPVSWRSSR